MKRWIGLGAGLLLALPLIVALSGCSSPSDDSRSAPAATAGKEKAGTAGTAARFKID